jgi:putative DNA primase/helicase
MVFKQNPHISQVTQEQEIQVANKPQTETVISSGTEIITVKNVTDETIQQVNDNQGVSIELNEPTPFYSETKEAEPYPIDAFPNSLKGVVEFCKVTVECDVAMIAPSLLCALSCMFQQHYTVSFKIGIEYFDDMKLSLAVIILAPSSERKSSLEKKIFKPFKDYERDKINESIQSIEDIKKKLNDWNDKNKALKSVITTIEKNISQETDTNKEETLRAKLRKAQENYDKFQKDTPQPIIPPTRNLIVKDITLEALQREYVTNTPFLAMINSEGGIFFNGYSMNNDNAYASLAKLCDLVDGEPIDVKRVQNGNIKLFNKALAIWLSVQPEVGKDFIRNGRATSQGFLPRCLLSQATEMAGTRFQETPYSTVKQLREVYYTPYCNRIKEVMETPYNPKLDNALELDRPHITLMVNAEERLFEFYKQIEREQQQGKAYYYHKSFAGKAMQRVVQIATLFTLYEGKHFVEKSYIEQAITIVTWHLKEAMRIIDGESDASLPPYDTERGLAENLRRYLFEKVFVNGNQNFNLRDLQNRLTRNKIGTAIRELKITYGKDDITSISDKYRYLIDCYLVRNEWLYHSNDNGISYKVNPKAL